MEPLKIQLLGQFKIAKDGQELPIASELIHLCIAYLALHREERVTRADLAYALWPDATNSKARTNLSNLLYRWKQLSPETHRCIDANKTHLQWSTSIELYVDVHEFDDIPLDIPEALRDKALTQWKQGIELYRGPLLQDAEQEWLTIHRKRRRDRYLALLHNACRALQAKEHQQEALHYAESIMEEEPFSESAFCTLLTLSAREEGYPKAKERYQEFCRMLQRELQIEPEAATHAHMASLQPGQESFPPVLTKQRSRQIGLLPRVKNFFAGRERECQTLLSHIQDPHKRLLCILGPGGVGKTRLANRVIEQHANESDDALYWVSLASLTQASQLPTAVAEQLRLLTTRSSSLEEQLIFTLQEAPTLLVLDNFEHVSDSISYISQWLKVCPALTILVTSQHQLHHPEEWVYRLTGLAMPDTDTDDIAMLMDNPAIALFVARAQQLQGDFRLSHNNKDDIVAICRRLQGIPLGLELAASWSQVISCRQIAAQCAEQFAFLTTPHPSQVPQRQQGLQAAFEYSWSLLRNEERTAYCQLSVFRGGFRWEAAHQVVDLSLGQLSALLARSLVFRVGEERYDLLEIAREFASQKLSEEPKQEERCKRAHCTYITEQLEKNQHRFERGELPDFSELNREMDNIRTALDWAIEQKELQLLSRSLQMLFLFYFVQNRQLEANELLDKIYQSVVSTEENTPLRERLLARLQTRKSLHQMDIQLFAHFSPERCKQHKRLFQRLGDKEEEAYCDLALAKYQSGTQQTNEAYLACAESALRQFREVGHVYFQAYTLSMLGHSELYPGNEEQGIAYLEEGMRLSIQAGQPLHYYELKTSCALSVIFCTHDLDKARRYLDECESMAHAVMSIKLGIPFGRGWLAQHAGHSADAIRHMQTCLEIAQKTKRYGAIANIHSCLGFFYALDKRAELAQQHFTESANALEKGYGRRSTIAAIRVRMAYFHICQGELERARTHLQSALQVDRSISKNSYLLEITAILALFQWHTNQRKEALQLAHNLYRNKHLQPLQKRLLQEIISEPQAIAAKTGDDGSVATLSELISQYDVSSQTTE